MCTVMLRREPGGRWPLLLAAVRDEFADRAWDPPAPHWPDDAPGLVGGRDRLAGGTWLAVRGGGTPAVAAVLNGSFMNRLDRSEPGAPSAVRPSRGRLPLRALLSGVPGDDELREYEVVHLVVADADGAQLISWDGREVTRLEIPDGDHIVTNEGLDVADDPLVPHFGPLLATAAGPAEAGLAVAGGGSGAGTTTASWWGDWTDLMRGDGLAGDDPRALLVRHEIPDGRVFASTSATLLALGREPGQLRMDFTATPSSPDWRAVTL
ncbi:NRDE family protein [Myceligenerans crystallogenes]|uniref:NRDE family protein n=1 Tax=Myceligenerans crystallogenes TaxID=316335 RepID=A0ABP4ZTQ1_9MICO